MATFIASLVYIASYFKLVNRLYCVLYTGILIQDQDHSLDRSQSYCQVVVDTCWAGLIRINRLVVKMLQSWGLHCKVPAIFTWICNKHIGIIIELTEMCFKLHCLNTTIIAGVF